MDSIFPRKLLLFMALKYTKMITEKRSGFILNC